MSALDTSIAPPPAPVDEQAINDAAGAFIHADVQRRGRPYTVTEANDTYNAFRKQYGSQRAPVQSINPDQYAQQNAPGFAKENTAYENIGGEGTKALTSIPISFEGVSDPKSALVKQQNVDQAIQTDPDATSTTMGRYGVGLPIKLAPLAVAGPAAPFVAAAQGVGESRIRTAGLREEGIPISGLQEASNAAVQGGIQGATAFGAGKIAQGLPGALAKAAPGLIPAATNTLGRFALNTGVRALGGAAENVAANTLSNVANQAIAPDPKNPIGAFDNTGNAAVVGAALPLAMHAGEALAHGQAPWHPQQNGIPIKGIAHPEANPVENVPQAQGDQGKPAGIPIVHQAEAIPPQPEQAHPVDIAADNAHDRGEVLDTKTGELLPKEQPIQEQPHVNPERPILQEGIPIVHGQAEGGQAVRGQAQEDVPANGGQEGVLKWNKDSPPQEYDAWRKAMASKLEDAANKKGLSLSADYQGTSHYYTVRNEAANSNVDGEPFEKTFRISNHEGNGKYDHDIRIDGDWKSQLDRAVRDIGSAPEGGKGEVLNPIEQRIQENSAKRRAEKPAEPEGTIPTLDKYTPKVYRQMHPDELREMFSDGNGIKFRNTFLASSLDMAQGQGTNAGGITVEFDPKAVRGQINKKPGWEFTDKQGHTEYTTTQQPSELGKGIKSFTVPEGIQVPPKVSRATNDWDVTKNADGSKTYTKPEAKAAEVKPEPKLGPGAANTEELGTTREHTATPENAPKVLAATFTPEAHAQREATMLSRIASGDFKGAKGILADHVNAVKDSLKRYASISFPALTRGHSPAGEAAAALTGTRETIKHQPVELTNAVFNAEGVGAKAGDAFDHKLGTTLAEDQLRGLRSNFTDRANDAAKRLAKNPNDTQAAKDLEENTAKAKGVKTFVGAPDYPFKTEADYQAALNDPRIASGIAAHRSYVEPTLEDNFKLSSKMDEGQEPPKRGRDTNTHISLKAIHDEAPDNFTSKALQQGGSIRNTLEKHSPLEREAMGNAAKYETRYSELVKNSVEKGTLPAAQARLYKTLVDGGLAKYGKVGDNITIDGKPTTAIDTRRRTIVNGGKAFADNERLYVRSDVAGEVKSALKQDAPVESNITRPIANLNNAVTLASGVEAVAHAANHIAVLFKTPTKGAHLPDAIANIPGVKAAAILDSVGTKAYKMITKNPGVQAELSKLAQIGALKPGNDTPISKFNILKQFGRGVDFLATSARLSLNDSFDLMVKHNLVEDTPTNRRDFVNQVGQYHSEASTGTMRQLKRLGLAPFATAGSTFYTQGLRTLAGDIGVKGATPAKSAALRAYVYAQLGGTLAMAAAANYLRTGKIQPAGTPWGSLYLYDDEDGKPVYIDVADIIGAKRGTRALGVDAAIEGYRNNQTPGTTASKAFRQAASAAISPFAGPLPSAIVAGTTGVNLHGLYKDGEPGSADAVKSALSELNPTIGGFLQNKERGGSATDFAIDQSLGKFGPRTGKAPDRIPQSTLESEVREWKRAHFAGLGGDVTPEKKLKHQTIDNIIKQYDPQNPDKLKIAFQEAQAKGIVAKRDWKDVDKEARIGPLYAITTGDIPPEISFAWYQRGTDEQKKLLVHDMLNKITGSKLSSDRKLEIGNILRADDVRLNRK